MSLGTCLWFVLLSFFYGSVSALSSESTSNYKDGILHYKEEVSTPSSAVEIFTEKLEKSRSILCATASPLSVSQVVNFGAEVWKVIEKNRAVANTNYTYANALPAGLKDSCDLEGFSDLQFRTFHVWGKNLLGIKVYDVVYSVVHRYQGSYRGHGAYLETVTVLPSKVSALWGYTVNMNVSKVSAVNLGTTKDPVASLTMQLEVLISTVMKKTEMRAIYEFRGDSSYAREIE